MIGLARGYVFSLWRGPVRVFGPVVGELAAAVAAEYAITLDDLRGPSARREYAWPRHELMRRALASGATASHVGRYLNRDHTTVLYGAQRARLRIQRADEAAARSKVVATLDAAGEVSLRLRGVGGSELGFA